MTNLFVSTPIVVVIGLSAATALGAEYVVCSSAGEGCDFVGNRALQQAVDEAASGDVINVRAGTYQSDGYRDVPYDDVIVRGYVLIDAKDLTVAGEDGALLDGGTGDRASAIVVSNADVSISNLGIRAFRPDSSDDDIYDGHGVFIVNGKARISSVRFEQIEKMAVSLRGDSAVVLEHSQLVDGHVGTWTEESAKLEVRDCLFRNNDSAGIAAYASSTVSVTGSTFESNLDDAVYAAENASIEVSQSRFVKNRPYAVRSVDNAQINVDSSRFMDNAADRYPSAVLDTTPQVDANDQGQ